MRQERLGTSDLWPPEIACIRDAGSYSGGPGFWHGLALIQLKQPAYRPVAAVASGIGDVGPWLALSRVRAQYRLRPRQCQGSDAIKSRRRAETSLRWCSVDRGYGRGVPAPGVDPHHLTMVQKLRGQSAPKALV
ncbi:hypothetical protein TNCV_3169821 [Trichonephila clavipes]|nr:hypothetical protein TNCV_3169821 [Trichonephila clavipes]